VSFVLGEKVLVVTVCKIRLSIGRTAYRLAVTHPLQVVQTISDFLVAILVKA
jgi:hypothetical protein